MSHFKTEGWVHFEGMDTLFSSDLACGSHSYHAAAAGTNAHSVSTPGPSCTIPSISANISTAPHLGWSLGYAFAYGYGRAQVVYGWL